jgi:hypothetical protein
VDTDARKVMNALGLLAMHMARRFRFDLCQPTKATGPGAPRFCAKLCEICAGWPISSWMSVFRRLADSRPQATVVAVRAETNVTRAAIKPSGDSGVDLTAQGRTNLRSS